MLIIKLALYRQLFIQKAPKTRAIIFAYASYILTLSKLYFGLRQSYISAFSRSKGESATCPRHKYHCHRQQRCFRTKYYVIASVNQGTPKDTFVLLGKRNKQAKDKHFRFLRKMIGQKRSLLRIARKGYNMIHSIAKTINCQ